MARGARAGEGRAQRGGLGVRIYCGRASASEPPPTFQERSNTQQIQSTPPPTSGEMLCLVASSAVSLMMPVASTRSVVTAPRFSPLTMEGAAHSQPAPAHVGV